MANRWPSCIGVLTVVLSALCALPAAAQGTGENIRLSSPDTSAFPAITVWVGGVSGDVTQGGGLSQDAVRVYEDGAQQPIAPAKVAPVLAGSQVAIVFDASGSMNQPGTTSKPDQPGVMQSRCDESKQAIENLLMTDTWFVRSKMQDRLMDIVPTGPGDYEAIVPWTHDYVDARNHLVQVDCTQQTTATPLYAMLSYALDHMKDAPGYEGRAKFLLVFSDGVDTTSPDNIDSVIQQAKDGGVAILAVRLGPPVTGAVDNLKYLADRTGGAFTGYTGPDALAPLYGLIKSQATQYAVTYPSTINRSGQHTVAVGVQGGGQEIRSDALTFGITVEPPAVSLSDISNTASPLVITRRADKAGTDPTTIDPRQHQISVQVTWPDGHPRAVREVRYSVNGRWVGTSAAGQTFVWDFSALAAGPYQLVAQVTDELGMVGTSDPLNYTIAIIIPTAVPIPTPTPTPSPIPQRAFPWLIAAALALAGLAALLAVYVLVRKPEPVQRGWNAIKTKAQELTQPIDTLRDERADQTSRASLVVVGSGAALGTSYPVIGALVMIGRDPDKSNIVLPETELSVSRRHASITCEADGVYWIRDEGSKSRTYVNRQEVPPAGRRLAPNDIIQLGRMTLRFVLQKGARGDETQPLDPASYLAPGMPGSSSAARNRDETETIAGQS
jgi:hypothetical protein